MKNNELKLLDEILTHLNHGRLRRETLQELRLELQELKYEIEDKELWVVVEKLNKDGYLDFKYRQIRNMQTGSVTRGAKAYYITFEGVIFDNSGGYRQKAKDDWWTKALTKANVIILALAAVAGAVYAGFEIWKYYYGYVNPCSLC